MSELPCDCEPSTSFYLTLEPRTLRDAIRDISKVRQVEPWVLDLIISPRPAEVVSLAHERAKRRPLIRGVHLL